MNRAGCQMASSLMRNLGCGKKGAMEEQEVENEYSNTRSVVHLISQSGLGISPTFPSEFE